MARIKYGSIISEVSGSIGSATFQKNLYGNTLRNRPRNTRSGTAAQFFIRSIMMQCQAGWRALNDAQRRQWNQYIAFCGATINRDSAILMTGHSLYLRFNFMRILTGLTLLNTLAYISMPASPSFLKIVRDGAYLKFYVTGTVTHTVLWFILKLSSRRSPSVSFSYAGLRYINCPRSTIDFWNIQILYTDIFGAIPAVGDTLHYSLQFFSVLAPLTISPAVGTTIVVAP